MRSILVALSLGLAAATVAYAHTADRPAPTRQAGTLTCRILDDVSLVLGNSRAAACRFLSDRGDVAQGYAAILPPRADRDAGTSRTIAWRVRSAGGVSRPGMLEGAFSPAKSSAVLHGNAADLEPVGETIEAGIVLGATDPRTDRGTLAIR